MGLSRETWIIIALVCIVALMAMRKSWRWAFLGKPNLALTQLGALFPIDEEVVVLDSLPRQQPGMRVLQVRDAKTSVIYSRSDFAETLDISVPGTFGLILTWRDGKVSRLTRVGGLETMFPTLSLPEARSIEKLLTKVRRFVATTSK